MDFLAILALYASSKNISYEDTLVYHRNYCQNLYFQPNALQKLEAASCDIYETETEIARVKSGRY